MITPESRDDASEKRRFATFMTMGVVALAATLVAFVSVPEFKSPRDAFKEIDPARLTQVRPEPEPESSQPEEEPEQEQQESSNEAEETTPQRVEAPDLQTEALQTEPSPSQAANPSESNASSQSSEQQSSVQVERTQVGGLESTDASNASAAAALPSTTSEPSSEGGGGGIAVEGGGSGSAGGGDGADFAGGGGVAAGNEDASSGDGSGSAVTVQEAQQEDYTTSVEASKLIQWMKDNPAPLPPGIEQLVGYQSTYLSSKITDLQTSEGSYEMYLMCKQSLREIHIVLVQGEEAKYLVDRSFQKQSRKFRVGPVRRSGQTIVGVQTRAQSRGNASQQFYSVFLSWWEDAKTDV
jgi:hypothetical protein